MKYIFLLILVLLPACGLDRMNHYKLQFSCLDHGGDYWSYLNSVEGWTVTCNDGTKLIFSTEDFDNINSKWISEKIAGNRGCES